MKCLVYANLQYSNLRRLFIDFPQLMMFKLACLCLAAASVSPVLRKRGSPSPEIFRSAKRSSPDCDSSVAYPHIQSYESVIANFRPHTPPPRIPTKLAEATPTSVADLEEQDRLEPTITRPRLPSFGSWDGDDWGPDTFLSVATRPKGSMVDTTPSPTSLF